MGRSVIASLSFFGLFLILLLASTLQVNHAFVAPVASTTKSKSTTNNKIIITRRHAVKKPINKDIKTAPVSDGPDYGKIALMFVNPVNPYAWFVYFFAFIIGYGLLNP